MRLRRITYTLPLFLMLLTSPLAAQADDDGRALYFSFYFAPPPTDAIKAAPIYQGFARSDDRGKTWHNLGWVTSAVSGFAVDPANPTRIVLATDYGVLASLDAGVHWKLISAWHMPPVLNVRLRGAEIWAATARGIFVTSNHGSQWTSRGAGLPSLNGSYVSDLMISEDVMLAATADGVFRSVDDGRSWFRSGLNGTPVFQLVTHPTQPDLVAAVGQERGLWISTDGGRLWSDRSAGMPTARIKCAAFDPNDSRTVLAGSIDMGVLRSTDLGMRWELSSGGLTNFNVTTLLFDRGRPDRVYAGAENGSFYSDNRGKTWQAFSVRVGYISAMEMW
ncbi:MAG: hypothetical protein RBU27_06465 [Bacteroidota bacterium]|jgi:photosystem II stability/assembly factor-like uncharacterized protein|nr:hypothetical protein [Bacteroidota bacterium]